MMILILLFNLAMAQDYGWMTLADGVAYQRQGKNLVIKWENNELKIPIKTWIENQCLKNGKLVKCDLMKVKK